MLPTPLRLPWRPGDDPVLLRECEWLVTNGLGGFASGTVLGVPTRRFHGIFVPNLAEPKGRHVVLPRLDELIETNTGISNLGGAEFVDGSIQGDAHLHLLEFRLEGSTPVWVFDVEGSLIEKSIVMPHGLNTVCVRWRLLEGPSRRLRLRPFVCGRRQDAPLVPHEAGPCEIEPDAQGALRLRLAAHGVSLRLHLLPQGAFTSEPHVDRDVLFRMERERGYDHSTHMHSPGFWSVELHPGGDAALIVSSGESAPAPDPDALFQAEHDRITALLTRAHDVGADADDVERRLLLAADLFIVMPGNRSHETAAERSSGGDDFRSVIAGYHWFNDWGRDTMIALEGLTLCTGRFDEARAILRTFAGYIRDGLLPNLFPEGGREALYHTVDATFWYFHALERYVARTGDAALAAELYPVLQGVIEHHVRGTRFGIGVDARDGLVHAAAEGLQLTWMDAKAGDWVVTPRRGKPVEIQALWYNALRLMAGWGRTLGAADAAGHDALADRVQASFEARFWSAERGYLFDVVDGPDPDNAGDDARLRPNQIFSLSLTHPVLHRSHWLDVLATVERHLLTPVGLRTLAPFEPGYQPRYEGALRERDGAYHQGTVWPWLLGHFVDAWIRVHGRDGRARALLQAVPQHLLETGFGSISEVFNAEPPHREGGCIAQAWSVAELLRAWQATRPQKEPHG
ncbi:MAG: glycogen debranching enzyme family protein [Methylibium sp.]|nr:glycogen debranching enzyme family protein [Methylibium sp.]